MSDSHLTDGKSLKKSSTQASGKDHSQLPSFGNFPKGHILRKIAAYHANRTSQKLPTISESDHPSSEAAPGQTAPIVGVRAAKSDHAAAVGVADSGRQNPPLPSNIPRLGKGIQQRRMKVVREEQAAMIARKRGENISKKALSTMEVIKSDVFRKKVREIPEDLYQACVKNMPSEVMSYMPPGYIWWEMNPTMQSRVFWVVYARYYLKHQEKEYMGTVVEYYARKLGMSAWPPVSLYDPILMAQTDQSRDSRTSQRLWTFDRTLTNRDESRSRHPLHRFRGSMTLIMLQIRILSGATMRSTSTSSSTWWIRTRMIVKMWISLRLWTSTVLFNWAVSPILSWETIEAEVGRGALKGCVV